MATLKFNTGNSFLWFGNKPGLNKITLNAGEHGHHYTLLCNERERIINIHKTDERKKGKEKYEQLFDISFFAFLRFVVMFNQANLILIRKYWAGRRINTGKLHRHNLIFWPVVEGKNFEDVFIDTKRKRKWRLKKEISLNFLEGYCLFPDELHASQHKLFCAYSNRKGRCKLQGLIFKNSAIENSQSFIFLSKNDLNCYQKKTATALFHILNNLDFKNKGEVLKRFPESVRNYFAKDTD
jgi:hypothetical protein